MFAGLGGNHDGTEPILLSRVYAPTGVNKESPIMKKSSIYAAAFGILVGMATAVPVEAMPTPTQTVSGTTDVIQARVVVKYRTWRGHRGFRYARPGYRRYNGYWFPPAAFGPTIVIRPAGRHWSWCGPRHNRYRCVR